MAESAWTFRGQLPDSAKALSSTSKLIVAAAREFVLDYTRLRHSDSEALLLKRLNHLAQSACCIQQTVRRAIRATSPTFSEQGGACQFAYRLLAQAVADVKVSLGHARDELRREREDDCRVSPHAFSSEKRGTDVRKRKDDNARLLATSQLFLWAVQGVVNSGLFETASLDVLEAPKMERKSDLPRDVGSRVEP